MTISTCGFSRARSSRWLEMYVLVLADDGHFSQYSKTSFRICGIKATWPFDGREASDARRTGRIAAEAMVDETGEA